MSDKRNLTWIVSVAVGVVGLILVFRHFTSNFVDSDAALVAWFPGPPARELVISVRDNNGMPRVNASVHAVNISGGTAKVTDANGIVVFTAAEFGGEDDLTGLIADDVTLMDRGALLGIGATSVVEGLHVHVIFK